MKRKDEETIEMRLYVPMSIHRLLKQKQANHREQKKPFKPLNAFALDALVDGLFKENFFEQMLKTRMEKEA